MTRGKEVEEEADAMAVEGSDGDGGRDGGGDDCSSGGDDCGSGGNDWQWRQRLQQWRLVMPW